MTSLAILRLRHEARELHRLGERLFAESEALTEDAEALLARSCAVKAAARAVEERAREMEDAQEVARLSGGPVAIRKGRR